MGLSRSKGDTPCDTQGLPPVGQTGFQGPSSDYWVLRILSAPSSSKFVPLQFLLHSSKRFVLKCKHTHRNWQRKLIKCERRREEARYTLFQVLSLYPAGGVKGWQLGGSTEHSVRPAAVVLIGAEGVSGWRSRATREVTQEQGTGAGGCSLNHSQASVEKGRITPNTQPRLTTSFIP